MNKIIEMSRKEMNEVLKLIPKELRKKLMASLKPSSGIELVQEFVKRYKNDDMFDHIMAHILSSLLRKISQLACEVSTVKEEKDLSPLSAIDLSYIAIECLNNEAKEIGEAMEEYEKSYKQGKDCSMKH